MTPRERICAAMRNEDVDYLPCSIYFNKNLRVEGYDCSSLKEKMALGIDLGVDPFVSFMMRWSVHPDVKVSNWLEDIPGVDYPILWQAWDTPEGRLTQAVRKYLVTENWETIHWGDESASSMYKPLIETHEEIELFRYLLQPTTEEDYARLLSSQQEVFDIAKTHDLPVIATYGRGLAVLMIIMGAEKSILLAMNDPDGFEQLAEIIHQCEMRNIELAARANVDILKRFGGYEMCNFYSPDIFKKTCLPRLKAEVEYAHAHGLLIYYRVGTGMEPLMELIADIGFDCIEGGEPHLSQCSLERWYAMFSGKATSWTGISTPALLGGNDPEAVRREVRHCVDVFGRKGYILGVTNSIRQHFPWDNALAMIDEWKKIR
jgi:hypothetical protein